MNKTKLGFFDLESLRLLEQNLEWQLKPCKTCGQITRESSGGIIVEGNEDNLNSIGMSVGVIRDASVSLNCVYTEPNVKSLINHLHNLDLIVGYNIRKFDYRVLEDYGGTMLKHLPTFDMFLEVQKSTKKRISLSNLAKRTLDIQVDKLGAKAVNKWWEGDYQEVIDYCITDVEITQELFNHACRKKNLFYWCPDQRTTLMIDTIHWPEKARSIVETQVEKVPCPVKEEY